jgi:hypothetical protein
MQANTHRSFIKRNSLGAWLTAIGLVVLCAGVLNAQQYPRDRPDRPPDRQDRQEGEESRENGVSAGGKWTEFRTEDPMTAAKRVRFELPADDTDLRDGVDQARVALYCTDGKLKLADFRPNVRLGRPDWPGFWGQPQMRVRVRADDSHDDHNWNWVNGHFLSMDKGTTRELLGARLFRIEFRTPDGPKIAEFSPAGMDLNLVKSACGLTPKKP